MEFHTLQSTHYGGAELCDGCEDSAPGVYASLPPMEFHTLQTIHYEGAELCDNRQDSATRVYAKPPTHGIPWSLLKLIMWRSIVSEV